MAGQAEVFRGDLVLRDGAVRDLGTAAVSRAALGRSGPPTAAEPALGREPRPGLRRSAARGLRRVLLVSDPLHMFRLRLEARRTALEAYTSPTESSPISDNPVLELRYLFAEGFKIPVAWMRSW